jgi:hypothetical protein
MNAQQLSHRVQNFETIAAQELLSAEQRAALREEVSALHETLDPAKTVKRYALGGAAAGVVLPVVGIFSGGALGALYGAYESQRGEIGDVRRRLEALQEQLG